MYEDHTIEERYLHNFSEKEKKIFYREQKKWKKDEIIYRRKLAKLLDTESPALFSNSEPRPNTALEIKYILNRIAADDSRDTKFELGSIDSIANPDRLALDIARAFQTNTVCKTVVLDHIGLTDNGVLPVLSVLRKKELTLLDISGNHITNKSLQKLDNILADPQTHWRRVRLGDTRIDFERLKSLRRHLNLFLAPATINTKPAQSPSFWHKLLGKTKGK